MRTKKQMTAFRLSNSAKDNLQVAVELQRRLDSLEGSEWMASRRNRTVVLEMAIAYFLTDVGNRVKAYADAPLSALDLGDEEPPSWIKKPAKSKRVRKH